MTIPSEIARGKYLETIQQLEDAGYRFHHDAMHPGYISRKLDGKVEEYRGRFGIGYRLHLPMWKTSRFHTVEYWTREEVKTE